jgi:hypothetical protein
LEGYPALRLRAGQALAAKPLAQIAEKKTSQDSNTLSAGAAGGEGGDPRLPALSKAEGLEGANRSRIAYRFAASAMTSPATRGSLTESSSQRIRPPVDHYKGLDEPAI